MTGRERILATLQFKEPDRVPHFEEIFDLNEEAFGRGMPSGQAITEATADARDRLLHACVEVYALIIERFKWDGLCIWHPWSGPDQLECLRIAKRELGDDILLGGYIGESIHAIDTTHDFDQFAQHLYEHPELTHAQALSMSDSAIAQGRAMCEVGVDFVNLVSDVAFNQGPFISPPMFREFIIPYMHRHIPALKAMGLIVIQHSDGNLMPILDDWISPGMHLLHSIDPMAGMDMAEVKRRTYGKVAIMGNVQCNLLQDGPDEGIRASARYALQHGAPGGGYIFSSSNTIFPGLPLRHYELMLEELAAYGSVPR